MLYLFALPEPNLISLLIFGQKGIEHRHFKAHSMSGVQIESKTADQQRPEADPVKRLGNGDHDRSCS